jgi:hypothetical protein
MSSFQGNASAIMPSKKDNKFVRSVKPPKTAVGSRRTKTEEDEEDKRTIHERVTKYGNREKASFKDKNLTSESSATSTTRLVPSNNINEEKSIKIYDQAVKINSESGSKAENENNKDENVNSNKSSVAIKQDIKHSTISKNSFEPSSQAVKLKKDENSKGTALSSKGTRFSGHSSKRSLLTGKKMSVKQLDVNKVYLQ